MAQTIRIYPSDGVRTLYPVDFDLGYIKREHVYIYTGEYTDFENTLDYEWIDDSQIELSTPLAIGQDLIVRRIVPRNKLVNDYTDGAILKEKNLDDSYAQSLMVWEEVSDGFYTTSDSSDFNFDLNMRGNSITGVSVLEEDDTSVITVAYGRDKYVDVDGDTMTAPLGGVNSVIGEHFMPQQQVVEVIDSRIESVPGFDPSNFQDYGLVTEAVGDVFDYGSI